MDGLRDTWLLEPPRDCGLDISPSQSTCVLKLILDKDQGPGLHRSEQFQCHIRPQSTESPLDPATDCDRSVTEEIKQVRIGCLRVDQGFNYLASMLLECGVRQLSVDHVRVGAQRKVWWILHQSVVQIERFREGTSPYTSQRSRSELRQLSGVPKHARHQCRCHRDG